MLIGAALPPDVQLLVVGLSAGAMLLFLLAGWKGRWLPWVGGYFLILAAVAVVFIAMAGPAQRSPDSGVPGPGDVSARSTGWSVEHTTGRTAAGNRRPEGLGRGPQEVLDPGVPGAAGTWNRTGSGGA